MTNEEFITLVKAKFPNTPIFFDVRKLSQTYLAQLNTDKFSYYITYHKPSGVWDIYQTQEVHNVYNSLDAINEVTNGT